VTLRDVAERAGVSVRTVSNVVNSFHYVSPAMRTRVQAALDELDYKPNLIARSLKQGRTGAIALLLPDFLIPYFTELAHETIEHANNLGLTVLVDETGGQANRELDLIEVIGRSRQVDGILLNPLGMHQRALSGLRPAVPVVLLGERTSRSTLDHVGIDNVRASREIVTHLIGLGHKRIAVIAGIKGPADATSRLRVRGYRNALAAAGLPFDPNLVVEAPLWRRPDGMAAMSQLLTLKRPPDAVFCPADTLAFGALRALHDHGVSVPEQMSVAGFDDVQEAQFSIPTLTTIAPDKSEIALQALQLLSDRISGSIVPPRDVRVGHHLCIRQSTAPRQLITRNGES
jgi:DNA-binding LacI/PurR family transcriptional regulator